MVTTCGEYCNGLNVTCPDCFKLARDLDLALQKVEGIKHDQGKPRLELLPSDSLEEIAKVLTFGAKKYSAENWRKGINYSRLMGAAMRHLLAWKDGEDKDPESGLTHLAHAGCCVLFLIWMEKNRQDLDDRFKLDKKGEK